jgi:hypothetical protein
VRGRRLGPSLIGVLALACLAAGPGSGASPSPLVGVRVRPPEMLFNESRNAGPDLAVEGTWNLTDFRIEMARLRAGGLLTLQLPRPRTTERPGPVVLLWQVAIAGEEPQATLRGPAWPAVEPELRRWGAGPVRASAAWPTCDATGDCVVRFQVAEALRGLEHLEGLVQPWLYLAFTAVRTFDDGSRLQVMPPNDTVGPPAGAGDGSHWYGTFFNYDVRAADRAGDEILGWPLEPTPEEISPRSYASLVRAELRGDGVAPADPTLRIDVWRPLPDAPGRRIWFNAAFTAPCPPDRWLVVVDTDPRTAGETARIPLGGLGLVIGHVDVPDEGDRLVHIVDATGALLTGDGLPEASGGRDVVVEGRRDCVTGKGAWSITTVEIGFPPDPEAPPMPTPESVAAWPTSAPSEAAGGAAPVSSESPGERGGQSDEPRPDVGLLALIALVAGGVVMLGVWASARRS